MSTKVYGYSDDLVEFDGTIYGECHADCYGEVTFRVETPESFEFTFKYGDDGGWRFTSPSSDEDLLSAGFVVDRLPEAWDMDQEDEFGYSDELGIPSEYTSATWVTQDGDTPVR